MQQRFRKNGLAGAIALGLMIVSSLSSALKVRAQDSLDVWPNLAPGETTRQVGEVSPPIPNEFPAFKRVVKITQPTFTVHVPETPNGTGVVILPGGGFGKVVPDKEGTDAAEWLNRLGVTAFVVSYRTKNNPSENGWSKPLQDAQRTLSLVRSQADRWHLKPDRIGLLGFSAGGQVAARLLCAGPQKSYDAIDDIDKVPHRPDFALLIYPWNLVDKKTQEFVEGISVTKECPPCYIVHTDDDASSSLGSVLFYAGLKRLSIPSELHVYGNGGHGYGLLDIKGSQISSWTNHAAHWLGMRGLLK